MRAISSRPAVPVALSSAPGAGSIAGRQPVVRFAVESKCVRISGIGLGLGEGLGRDDGVGASVGVAVTAEVGAALVAAGPADAPPHATRSAEAAIANSRRIFTSLLLRTSARDE